MNTQKNNYIVSLKTERDELRAQMLEFENRLNDYLSYLALDKFYGFENSYVNVDDVRRFITELRNDMRYTVATV